MDKLSPEKRSENMKRIRSKNTKPELLVRSVVKSLNYRYRLHYSKLPGRPDIYVPRIKTAIFVHGCFWHQHKRCKKCFMPKSNIPYWKNKLRHNVLRFKKVRKDLAEMGYFATVIWECETVKVESLYRKLKKAGL